MGDLVEYVSPILSPPSTNVLNESAPQRRKPFTCLRHPYRCRTYELNLAFSLTCSLLTNLSNTNYHCYLFDIYFDLLFSLYCRMILSPITFVVAAVSINKDCKTVSPTMI